MLDVTTEEDGAVTVVSATGSIDALTAETLTAAMSAALARGRVHLVADLSGVDYTSSAGLRTLLGAVKEARRKGGDLRLAAVQERVRRILDIAGFTGILQIHPDRAAAVASFAS